MSTTPKYKIKDLEAVLRVDGELRNVRVTRLSPPGENYLSVVLGIEADVVKNGRTERKSAVAKCIPPGERKFVQFHVHSMKNEIRWYTDIVPLFRAFAQEHGLSNDLFPTYLGSRINHESTQTVPDLDCVLLLENLKPQGYDNDDRYIGCDLVTSKAILKTLALFHAIPLGLKRRSPEKFKIFRNYIDSCKFPDMEPPAEDESGDGDEATPESAFVEAVHKIPECAPYLDKLIPYVSQPIGPPDCNTIGEEPWSTVSHNDVWVNNIMIKRRKNGGPLVKLVDFQMCGYKSFALDVVFFLLTSVINDVLRESFDDLIRYYYEELTGNLVAFGVDLDLTYDKYLKELEDAARGSEIAHSLVFSNIVFGEKGTGVDIAVEEFNPMVHMTRMIQNMGDNQRRKIVLIASECAKRNWL